jgi:hypothetical protein
MAPNFIYFHMCVCVCVRAREREREKEIEIGLLECDAMFGTLGFVVADFSEKFPTVCQTTSITSSKNLIFMFTALRTPTFTL